MNWFGFAAYYKFRIGFQIQPKKIIETRDMAEVKINKKKKLPAQKQCHQCKHGD